MLAVKCVNGSLDGGLGLHKGVVVAPLSDSTRMADPNRFRDARLILFIYLFFFQKCRDPNPWLDPNGGSEPEPDLLRPFSFILSKHFIYVISF